MMVELLVPIKFEARLEDSYSKDDIKIIFEESDLKKFFDEFLESNNWEVAINKNANTK